MTKTALITGAAVRIGRAIALDLAANGWAVGVHYNTSEKDAANTVAEIRDVGGRAVALQADLGDAAALCPLVDAATEKLGPVTLLINNASAFEEDHIGSLTDEGWRRHMNVNLAAPVFLSQAFADKLPAEQSGNVIHILDQRVWKPTPQFFSYSLSKSALWSATVTMAQALAPRIRVNAIGPGPTLANHRQDPNKFAEQIAALPLQKGPQLDEIASTVRFLVDHASITGQMIAADGGQHLAWQTPDVAEGIE